MIHLMKVIDLFFYQSLNKKAEELKAKTSTNSSNGSSAQSSGYQV